MAHQGRRNADQVLLMALACGATAEAAAKTAGIGPATVYRRLKDPKFCRRLKKTQADMLQRTSGMLTGATGEAVKTLLTLMRDPTPAAVRLGAARTTLEITIKMREVAELAERLTALEEQLQAAPRMRLIGRER
jgi:hypothetical protein